MRLLRDLKKSRPPQQSRLRSTHLPAPVGGINTFDAAGLMPPTDCVYLYNAIGADNGLRVRLGYSEQATGLDGEVRTVLPFVGSSALTSKLFACTPTGIWDVTSKTAAPVRVYTFPNFGGVAGWGVGKVVVTNAGHFLLYADEANGYLVYSESTGLWALVPSGGGTGITGVDPRKLAFVTVWKNRVIFVERDSARMWYLDVGAIYGAATAFELGNKFQHGGTLVGVWSWTLDGGAGIDDLLVGISSAGDLVIYQGTNPNDANAFGSKGSWFLGGVPLGRRICTDFGGDILILSASGVLPLSKLPQGGEMTSPDLYTTKKVNNLLNRFVAERRDSRGWELRLHPEDNTLLINLPDVSGQKDEQLALSLSTKGWSRYRGLPMLSSDVWQGRLYFGTADGRVCVTGGYLDNVKLDGPDADTVGVDFGGLSGFQNLGTAESKRVQLIKPFVIADGGMPQMEAQARYDFNAEEVLGGLVFASYAPDSLVARWDVGSWDVSTWAPGIVAEAKLGGAEGLGSNVAVAFRGVATARTTVVGFDVIWDAGGLR